jgi:hypothetical protein
MRVNPRKEFVHPLYCRDGTIHQGFFRIRTETKVRGQVNVGELRRPAVVESVLNFPLWRYRGIRQLSC